MYQCKVKLVEVMPSPFGRVSSFRPVMASPNWLRFAHKLTSPAKETSQKIHRARVNNLVFGADRLLLTPRANTLESYLMSKLSDAKFHNTYRSVAFMRLVRFCLERHLFDVALALYDRMLKEGFLAVYSLSLRMTALNIVQQAKSLGETLPPLKKLFEQEAYDVAAFIDLAYYLTHDKHASGEFVDDLAHAFASIRQIKLTEYPDLVGELASINMRADRLDAAQTWLQAFEDMCGAQGVLPDVAPYSEIINTLNEIDPMNGDAIQDVLFRMKSAGVSPDASVFNALIRVNLVRQRYQEAFALYQVLMEKRSDELMPNDVTYKMLFRATNLLSHPRLARRLGRPENAVPPRSLFREMLACHLEQTKGRPLGQVDCRLRVCIPSRASDIHGMLGLLPPHSSSFTPCTRSVFNRISRPISSSS
ncbi:hypothetical protein J3R83DRAFT_289 [Lanmaoa asiatica]|nr:hypothetical protein J3R83DRAFT_289 [Lanmaoa asiatica]